jgi:hypothetical protein
MKRRDVIKLLGTAPLAASAHGLNQQTQSGGSACYSDMPRAILKQWQGAKHFARNLRSLGGRKTETFRSTTGGRLLALEGKSLRSSLLVFSPM